MPDVTFSIDEVEEVAPAPAEIRASGTRPSASAPTREPELGVSMARGAIEKARGLGRGAVKSVARMAYNLGRGAYATPIGRISDALYGADVARAAFGADEGAPEYGAFDADLQYADPAEQIGGVATDIASAFIPVTAGARLTNLAAKAVPLTGRAARLAARLGKGATEATTGAVIGQAQQADAGTGGVVGGVLGTALGRSAAATEALAAKRVSQAKQRVGQAIATTTKPNKRFVERNAVQIARETPWFATLEQVQTQAVQKAEAAGKQIDRVLAGVRQGDRSTQLRSARTQLQSAAASLLARAGKVGVELAPKTREALETVVQGLASANPRSTSLDVLQSARAAIDAAVADVGVEVARRSRQVTSAGAVRQAFDQALRGGAVSRTRTALRGARREVDTLTREVAPSRIKTAPILGRLAAMRRTFQGVTDAGDLVTHNEAAASKLDELMAEIRAYGSEMSVDQARKVRQTWDNIVAGADGKGFLSNLADESKRGATKLGANVLRSKIAQQVPDLVAPNQAFNYNRNLADAIGDTLTRRTGQTKGPLAGIASIVGSALGGGAAAAAGGVEAGLVGATAGPLLYAATRIVKSPEFNLLSAKARLALADSLRSGRTEAIRAALRRAVVEAETQRVGGMTAATASLAPDLTDDEFQLELERLGAGEGVTPGILDETIDPSDIYAPLPGPEDDLGPPIDPFDAGGDAVEPSLPDLLLDAEDEGLIEPQAGSVPRGTLDRADVGGDVLRAAGEALAPLSEPLLNLTDDPARDRVLGALERFTSPLDLAFAGTSALRPLAAGTRALRAVEGAGRLASGATALQGVTTAQEGLEARRPWQTVGGLVQAALGASGLRAGGPTATVARAAERAYPIAQRLLAGAKAGGVNALAGPAAVLSAETVMDSAPMRRAIPDDETRALVGHGLQAAGLLGTAAAVSRKPARVALKGEATFDKLAARLDQDGGFSVDLKTGTAPETGTFVGLYPNTDRRVLVVPREQFTPKVLRRYVAQMRSELGQPDRVLGGWVDGGKVYLDVPQRIAIPAAAGETPARAGRRLEAQERQAIVTGGGPSRLAANPATRARDAQLSTFTLDTFNQRDVGDWRGYLESPTFARRVTAMAVRGRGAAPRTPEAAIDARLAEIASVPESGVYAGPRRGRVPAAESSLIADRLRTIAEAQGEAPDAFAGAVWQGLRRASPAARRELIAQAEARGLTADDLDARVRGGDLQLLASLLAGSAVLRSLVFEDAA